MTRGPQFQRSTPGRVARLLHTKYNNRWIQLRGLDVPISVIPTGADSNPFQVVWLKNVDRLLRAARSLGDDSATFDFIDVGCGSGIASIYAQRRYSLKNSGGFDLDPSLVEAANRNARRSGFSARFWVGDAAKEIFSDKRCFLFFFNPFGEATVRSLLANNWRALADSQSTALLANDHALPVFLEYGTLGWRDNRWNCSVVQFGRRTSNSVIPSTR